MSDKNSSCPRNFPSAADDAERARQSRAHAELLTSASYRLAYDDQDFMLRDEMRPMRLMLELSKPELVMSEHGIDHTVVMFGSSRVCDLERAQAEVAQLECECQLNDVPNPMLDQALKKARTALEYAQYYEQARKLAGMISARSQDFAVNGFKCLHVITGGGPGIMEAANRGAKEAGGKTVGLNIVLPHEQHPNAYIDPELCFRFHYFAMRKMHFLMRARAIIAFPGGFGTLDELFETLTLVQTQKIRPLPILLFGEQFWRKLINFDFLLDQGLIDAADLDSFCFVETAEEAWQKIAEGLGREA